MNTTFDGDQLNVTLPIDNKIAEDLEAFAPYKSVFDNNTPRKISRNISIPKTVVSSTANWIHSEPVVDLNKLSIMESMPNA